MPAARLQLIVLIEFSLFLMIFRQFQKAVLLRNCFWTPLTVTIGRHVSGRPNDWGLLGGVSGGGIVFFQRKLFGFALLGFARFLVLLICGSVVVILVKSGVLFGRLAL